MTWLDCYDVDSTLASFEGAIGADPEGLASALIAYQEGRFAGSENPYLSMPKDVLELFDSDVDTTSERFAGMYCFHGTRAIDPESFLTRGILPLDAMLEEIWATLRELAPECTDEEWASFREWVEDNGGGDGGRHYRNKSGHHIHFGPHGELVRAIFLNPAPSNSVDYLAGPEIVQDIAGCAAESVFELDLWNRFYGATKPCLVKFRAPLWSGAVTTALWSAYEMLREGEIGSRYSCGGFAGNGKRVPAEDVVDVEIVKSWISR